MPPPPTPRSELDQQLLQLRERSGPFASLPVARRIDLLRRCMVSTRSVAAEWVAASCRAKGLANDGAAEGEEWIVGPAVTLRNMRLLVRSLDEIRTSGVPAIAESSLRDLPHGALGVRVAPYDVYDGALYQGVTAETWLGTGIARGALAAHQASFYRRTAPEGRVSLVLGAGNTSSIPPMDVLQKMFVEGEVVLLKMNPVNEYLGPILERALAPAVEQGYLAIVYGGADTGSYLCDHPAVSDVHITGSNKTHDRIVWGPPGSEQDDRKRRNAPVLAKPITSELGNVSPVLIVPGPYSDAELASVAENVAGMMVNNASFNCNAAKLLVLARGWDRREAFVKELSRVLGGVTPRSAYYPGAFDRHAALSRGHSDVRFLGQPTESALPWTLVLGLDPDDRSEANFFTEPFCAILSEVAVGSDDPVEFLAAAVSFANDRVWGTLSASLVVHPEVEASREGALAVQAALRDLRYGTVAVNAWAALGYALCSTPWGGYPGATLADIQSGIGWVHNTLMLEVIEKCVIRAPLVPSPKPPYFPSHRTLASLGRRLVEFEAEPSWLKVPGLAVDALRA